MNYKYPLLVAAVLWTGPAFAASQAVVSCESLIGARAAKVLVDDCRNVSPATRPPCHAANSCDLIISEIVRSCTLFPDMTKECSPYMKNKPLVKRIKAFK